MKKILKKVVAILSVMFFAGNNIFSTINVIDIAGLMNAVNQLYAIYDNINATIEQVQNTYKQLDNQIKAAKAMNWDDLKNSFSDWSSEDGIKGTWENIGKFRNNLTNATSAINSNLNLLNDVKYTLENKTVTTMGKQYSVAGLFGIGKYGQNTLLGLPADASEYVRKAGKEVAQGFEGTLTYAQKQAIMSKWGLDPENYAYVKLIEEQVTDLSRQLFIEGTEEWYTAKLKEAADTNDGLMDLMQKAGEDGSMMSQFQATGSLILHLKETFMNLEHGVQRTAALWATEAERKKIQEELKEEQKTMEREKERKEFMEITGRVPKWL